MAKKKERKRFGVAKVGCGKRNGRQRTDGAMAVLASEGGKCLGEGKFLREHAFGCNFLKV